MPVIFDDALFLKRKGIYEKVAIKEIAFLEVTGDYVCCFLINEEQFTIRISLNEMELLLAAYGFMRIHRSYLIQLNQIIKINFQENLLFIGRHQLPINRNSKKALNDLITKLD